MGKVLQSQVNNGAQLSCLSEYQNKKRNSRQETCSKNKDDKNSTKYCGNCGRTDHMAKLNDRREHCPAFDKVCHKCDTNGHFAHLCRGGPTANRKECSKIKNKNSTVNEVKTDKKQDKQKDANAKDANADLGTLSGSWLLIIGIDQDTTQGDQLYEV